MKKKHYIRKYSPLWVLQKTVQAVAVFVIMCFLGSADSISEAITNVILH